jgi:hypothetical protein
MHTFEEKFAAWFDGVLSKEEAVAFEKEHLSLRNERTDLLKLRSLLKENLGCAELPHPASFNAQIMARARWVSWCRKAERYNSLPLGSPLPAFSSNAMVLALICSCRVANTLARSGPRTTTLVGPVDEDRNIQR